MIAEQGPGAEHAPLAGVKGGTGELDHEAVVGVTRGILRDNGGKVLTGGRGIVKPGFKALAGGFEGDPGLEVALENGRVGCAVEIGRVSQSGKGGGGRGTSRAACNEWI